MPYVDFAKNMEIEDKVLIIVHHFPFAVVTVSGDYNYIRNTEPEIGVWFRHFRRIKYPVFYSDYFTNARSWEQYVMTDTISIGHLEKPASLAFRGALRDLSIGERVINQRLTLQMIMPLPPNPHPVEVFRCSQY